MCGGWLWTPHWFPLPCDGSARPGACHTDGAVLALARRREERTYPEIAGRWSSETTFVRLLATAKVTEELEQAWRLRWVCLRALQRPFWIFALVGWMVMCRRPMSGERVSPCWVDFLVPPGQLPS